MGTRKPTLILVHGAWHTSACWEQLISHLQPLGYKCVTIDLPSTGPAETLMGITLEDDIAAIRQLILDVLGQGEDAVVVSHSVGCVASQAATSQLPSDQPGKVLAIALIASVLIPPQMSVLEWSGGPAPMHDIDEANNAVYIGGPGAKDLFYHDLPDHVADKAISDTHPAHAYSALSTPPQATSSGHLDGIPTHFLVTTLDPGLPLHYQQKMIVDADAMMAEKGFQDPNWKHIPIRVELSVTGHTPFVGDEERVARCGEFVRRSAGENIPVT